MSMAIDPLRAAQHCRCGDPTGVAGRIYLSPYCAYAEAHLRWEDYGMPQTLIIRQTQEYHQKWLDGEYNSDLPAEMQPGYRGEVHRTTS